MFAEGGSLFIDVLTAISFAFSSAASIFVISALHIAIGVLFYSLYDKLEGISLKRKIESFGT